MLIRATSMPASMSPMIEASSSELGPIVAMILVRRDMYGQGTDAARRRRGAIGLASPRRRLAGVVARRASEFEFGGDAVAGVVMGRVVVVLEEIGSSAIDAGSVAFSDQSLLAAGWVTSPVRGVDRVTLGVVDQGADERCVSDRFDN